MRTQIARPIADHTPFFPEKQSAEAHKPIMANIDLPEWTESARISKEGMLQVQVARAPFASDSRTCV